MIAFPPAKINIGLEIVGKRKDGFHEIESVFYPFDLTDILEIIEAEEKTRFSTSGIPVPGNSDSNLCLKAYKLLKQDFDLPPVNIHLHKIVPIGAGLGGGSSDAAGCLNILNKIFKLGLSVDKRKQYAEQLGSDCSFFVEPSPAYVTGRGEKIKYIDLDLSGSYLYLIHPEIHVSTAEAYAGITPQQPEVSLQKSLNKRPVNEWRNLVFNSFEEVIFNRYPEIKAIKEKLYASGALYASITGTGSAVYGIFNEKPPQIDFPQTYFIWVGAL